MHTIYDHNEKILRIDTFRAFYAGKRLFVECDVILNEDMTVKESQ